MEEDAPTLARIYAPMAAVAACVLIVDQVTKEWATGLDQCRDVNPRPAVGFCLAHNKGMAFSFGWGSGALIGGVAIAIVITLVVMARKVQLWPRLLMGLVAGGALGNVLDRAFRAPQDGKSGFMQGAVVDFLYSRVWATFNVADSCIVVGGILLSIALWRMPDPDEEQPPPAAPSEGDNEESAQLAP